MRTLIRISMLAALLATVGSTMYVAASNIESDGSAAFDDCAKKRARGRKCDDDDNRNGNSNGNNNSNGNRISNNNRNSNGNGNSNGNSNRNSNN